jgi:hypothetical protein
MEMLAAQAAHSSGPDLQDEQAIANDDKMSDEQKRATLQKLLNMAASNGDVEKVQKLLNGSAKPYIDVNAPDEDGTPPLIYASCFVSLYRLPDQRTQGADPFPRAMSQLSELSFWAAQTSTNRIATSGALSCGQ